MGEFAKASWLLLLALLAGAPAFADDAPVTTIVSVAFRPTSFVTCVAQLSALGLDGRTVLLPDGETKESYCKRQFPEPPTPGSASCECPAFHPEKPIKGYSPPPCHCPIQEI